MSAIHIKGLVRDYPGGTRALNRVDLEVPQGEIFGLLGVNGAGKSTLIKIVATLMRPQAGSVRVMGRDPQYESVKIKRLLGVVPQENNLDNELSLRQNLEFHCRYSGLSRRVYAPRIDHWLERLELTPKQQARIMQLSGGTRRKVMLAKAFLTEPRLLVLDEPTNGLDPAVRQRVWSAISEFRETGGTVFLSSHNLDEVEQLCDRAGVLHQGRLKSVQRLDREQAQRERPLENAFREALGAD
ncbi:MAG: ABC transporter ATP-binding protein [Candidatus Thiodiazotropha sp.]